MLILLYVAHEPSYDRFHKNAGRIYFAYGRIKPGGDTLEVAGLLKNFNYSSLQHTIGPLGIFIADDSEVIRDGGTDRIGVLFARIRPHVNIPTLVGSLRKLYEQYDQTIPFSFEFADDAYDAQYKAEEKLADMLNILTVLTVLIAALGLLAWPLFPPTGAPGRSVSARF